MRDTSACDDCVVTVLFSQSPFEIDESERVALDNLADAGLCPPLRLVVDPETGRRRAG
ncbi:hypothetical protein BH23ACT5_BH23ACT5_11870 [soil metagenome]